MKNFVNKIKENKIYQCIVVVLIVAIIAVVWLLVNRTGKKNAQESLDYQTCVLNGTLEKYQGENVSGVEVKRLCLIVDSINQQENRVEEDKVTMLLDGEEITKDNQEKIRLAYRYRVELLDKNKDQKEDTIQITTISKGE